MEGHHPGRVDEISAQIEQTFAEGRHGNCEFCESGCDHRESGQFPRFAKRMYAVNGGEGGAGKSSVTVLQAGEGTCWPAIAAPPSSPA